jgi:hypothetical protein
MKKGMLIMLILGFVQMSRSQSEIHATYVKFDSMSTDPTAEAGKGFVYSNGVKGLYFLDLNHLGKILDSASIAPLTANITWNSTSIPGLKLNRLSTTNENGLSGFVNGELWYNTTMNSVRARINGEMKTMLKSGDGIGASFQANEVLIGVTASDSLTGVPKLNNALALVTTSTGIPTWFAPSSAIMVYEDWPTNNTRGLNDWTTATNGAGAVVTTTAQSDSNHPGVIQLSVAGVNDVATIHDGTQTLICSGGILVWEGLIYINNLSSSSDNYDLWAGFGDVTGPGDMTDGVYFHYDLDLSPNWRLATAANNARTKVSSNRPVESG